MQSNNISFTSTINIVDKYAFERIAKGKLIDFDLNAAHLEAIEKADEFHSFGIRTCSGGGISDINTGEAAGFHNFDSKINFERVEQFIDLLFKKVKNPTNALLIGGKELSNSPFSMEQFTKIKELLAKRVENLTVFEKHILPWSESDFHYSSNTDTWTIHSMFRPRTDFREYDILNVNTLRENFGNIKISPADKLQIQGVDVTV